MKMNIVMSNAELALYFDTGPRMVKKQLLRKPRIYVALCDICDHARFMHDGYHSDYSVGIKVDRCHVEDCDCSEFKAQTKPRSPFTIEAARAHVEGIILHIERRIEEYSKEGGYHVRYCMHCNNYMSGNHIIECELVPILNNSFEDRNKLEEVVAAWVQTATLSEETEKHSSMPMKINNKSCTMFRSLKCFKYIFPDDAVAKHGDGFVHKICMSKRYLVRS